MGVFIKKIFIIHHRDETTETEKSVFVFKYEWMIYVLMSTLAQFTF